MENKLLITFVIPVYNGRKYLAELLDSLLLIKLENIEIIIVDDGSTDDSPNLVSEYCKNSPKIQYYRQNNQGIVGARNTGLTLARGEYLLFCDQDDKIDASVIYNTIYMMQRENADIGFYSTQHFNDKGDEWECDTVFKEGVYRDKEVADIFIRKLITRYAREEEYISYIGHIWAGIFKRTLISDNKIIFKRFMAIEDDLLFVLDSLDHAQCVITSKSVGYYWRSNPASATKTNSYTKNHVDKMKVYYQYRTDILIKHKICSDKEMEEYLIGMRQEFFLNLLFNESLLGFKKYLNTLALIKHELYPDIAIALSTSAKCPYAERNKRIIGLMANNHIEIVLAGAIFMNYKRQIVLWIKNKFNSFKTN